jgi:drug/metabolite transporter (DMT)-like permease
MRRKIQLLCTIGTFAFAFLFLILPLMAAIIASPGKFFSDLVCSFVPCFIATAVLFCIIAALILPLLMLAKVAKIPLARLPLKNHLGSIWMLGAVIGVCMFCFGLFYGMQH